MVKTLGGLCAVGLLLAACASDPLPDFNNAFTIEGADKDIAFVGRKIAVVQVLEDRVQENGDEIVIKMDLGFLARYEILELVHGAYPAKTIDFEAYDHYGFPRFARPDVAMMYLTEFDGKLYHRKYQWDAVSRTKGGRYAACGDPYFYLEAEELAEVERRPLSAIEFDPPVTFRIADELKAIADRDGFTDEELADRREKIRAYYAAPVFDVKNGVATCRMGVYADELYRIRYETTFRPRARREMCEDEVGYTASDFRNEEKKAARAACIDARRTAGDPR
jgi:hypothetical protein